MTTGASLPARVLAHIRENRLFRDPGEALVAVSGGVDSVALLDLLSDTASELGLSIAVAHVDHGIQSDSRTVGLSVKTLAEKYGLPFESTELRLGSRLRRDLLEQGRHAASDRRAWDHMLDIVPELALTVQGTTVTVARASVSGYDNALSVALLRAAARRVGLVLGPTRARQLVGLAQRPSGRRLPLGDGWSAEVAFDQLRIGRDAGHAVDCALDRVWPSGDRGSARFGEFEIQWSPAAAPAQIERATWTTWLDSAAWEVRRPARGDSLVPLGGVGHRPLRRLLMEARVPRRARPRYPAISRGATILWAAGLCRSAEGGPAPGNRAGRLGVNEHGSAEADGGA